MKKLILLVCSFSFCYTPVIKAQQHQQPGPKKNDTVQIISDIKLFFENYAEDLQTNRREAIIGRYDPSGYYRLGNGNKRFYNFEQLRTRYLTNWTAPKSFEWKDISIDVISLSAVAVTALFELGDTVGKQTFSYSALLLKHPSGWKIRIEDESTSPANYTTQPISGSNQSGPYKYLLTAHAGASITAHRHSSDMHITVRSGRKFIIMGDLDTGRVKRYEAGSSFVIPAGTWHVEWWEEETVEEIGIIAPMRTERASPVTPRKS